jgi:hypothetical protein
MSSFECLGDAGYGPFGLGKEKKTSTPNANTKHTILDNHWLTFLAYSASIAEMLDIMLSSRTILPPSPDV